MRNKSGAIGSQTETAVVNVLRASGWPDAERRRLKGELDQGDIICGTSKLCWEVKGGNAARNASSRQIEAWLMDTERERVNADAQVGVLVVARKGVGYPNADRWWAIVRFETMCRIIGVGPIAVPQGRMPFAPVRMELKDMVELLRAKGFAVEQM